MTELLAAIETAWATNVTLAVVPKPYLDLAPEDATYPHATYSYVPGAAPGYEFGRTTFEKTDLQFTLRDTNLATVLGYSRALDDLLNKPTTKLATEAPVAVMSQFSRHPPIVRTARTQSPAGLTVYEAIHTYRFETHRDLP